MNVSVYNVMGRRVDTLINERQRAGNHEITWNPKNLASGVYFYRIRAGDFSETRKMLLLK